MPPTYTKFEATHFEDDHGSNNHGWYSLKAVLTHKGRSIDGGHYIAWTKQEDGRWVKFDDDTVSHSHFKVFLAVLAGLDNLSTKNRLRDRFFSLKSRQVTIQGLSRDEV